LSTPTVRRRISRIEKSGALYMGPIIDLYAKGYEHLIFLGITVHGRLPVDVARDVAALPCTLHANRVFGSFDIQAILAVKSKEEIGRLLHYTIASLPGVHHLTPSLVLDAWKFQSDRVPPDRTLVARKRPPLDALNLGILECLHEDARMSQRSIAERLGITESTVRTRIRQMRDNKQMRMTAVRQSKPALSQPIAYLGIKVTGAAAADVCAALAALPEISFVGTALGPFPIIACAELGDLQQLMDFMQNTVVHLDGVLSVESSYCIEPIKYREPLGLVL
jgi:DNA-binding Lrp family transcriptional regulator